VILFSSRCCLSFHSFYSLQPWHVCAAGDAERRGQPDQARYSSNSGSKQHRPRRHRKHKQQQQQQQSLVTSPASGVAARAAAVTAAVDSAERQDGLTVDVTPVTAASSQHVTDVSGRFAQLYTLLHWERLRYAENSTKPLDRLNKCF